MQDIMSALMTLVQQRAAERTRRAQLEEEMARLQLDEAKKTRGMDRRMKSDDVRASKAAADQAEMDAKYQRKLADQADWYDPWGKYASEKRNAENTLKNRLDSGRRSAIL